MFYERRGSADPGAPAVLLLHGLGSSAADWAPQLAAFGARYRLLLPDLPGHWRSARPPGRLTVEGMAARVAALLDDLGEPPAHVVGISLGASVGLALALAAPGRVRSLTLINAFARLAPPDAAGALRMALRLVLLATAPMTAVAALVARGLFPKPGQGDLYRAAVASLSRTQRRAYLASIGALAAFDARARLREIRCPTLVLAGDRDRTVGRDATEALARGIPGAGFVLVPDSGHATTHDQPDLFNRAVLEFLASR
ncbi:MAG: alpha/beta fold hydrolase [Candidatus Rokubacteria bacterium]|nr:alpha/beta fold hydrolase [Candidatus Rokubacteria bacterium]